MSVGVADGSVGSALSTNAVIGDWKMPSVHQCLLCPSSATCPSHTQLVELLADLVYLLACLEECEWLLGILAQQRLHYALQEASSRVCGMEDADFCDGDGEGVVGFELQSLDFMADGSRMRLSSLTRAFSLSCCFSYWACKRLISSAFLFSCSSGLICDFSFSKICDAATSHC